MSPLRLALPIRTSERKAGGMSPKQQRERAEEVARRAGYEIARVFDSGKSESGKTLDRAALREIRAGIRAGEFDGIVVGYLDRLGRAPIEESMTFIRSLVGDGGVLVAADWGDEPIDLADPNVEDMLVFRLQMNRSQWNKAADRHRENKRTAMREGKFVGQAPFGYAKRGGRLVEHPVEGNVVREVFRRVARGTLADGVDYLSAEAPTRTRRVKGETVTYAAHWNTDSVRKLLDSRTYLGEHGHAGVDGYRRHDALTTEALYQATQTKLDPRDRRRNGDYLLSGLVFCAQCGEPLSGQLQSFKHRTATYRRYRCSTKSCGGGSSCNADKLDDYVRDLARVSLGDRELRADLMPDGLDDALFAWEQAQDELRAYSLATSARSPLFAEGLDARERDAVETESEYRRLVGLAESFEVLPEADGVDDDTKLARALRIFAARGFTFALRRGRGSLDDRVVAFKDGKPIAGALAA